MWMSPLLGTKKGGGGKFGLWNQVIVKLHSILLMSTTGPKKLAYRDPSRNQIDLSRCSRTPLGSF